MTHVSRICRSVATSASKRAEWDMREPRYPLVSTSSLHGHGHRGPRATDLNGGGGFTRNAPRPESQGSTFPDVEYAVRRQLRRPIVAWRRRRPVPDGMSRRFLEASGYSRAFRDYAEALRRDSGMMVDFDLRPGALVLDVGAHMGIWSRRVLASTDARGQRDVTILGFEPDPSGITACEREHAEEPRFVLHPYGLAGRTRTAALTLCGRARPCSSR